MAAELSPRLSSPAGLTALGAAGTVLLAVSSWWVAAVPAGWSPLPVAARIPLYVAYYAGLCALLVSWLLLGRRVVAGDATVGPDALRRYLLACAVPLLAAAPFGRDLWAYAAQGNLLAHGVDPYTHGPSAVPGSFTAQVSGRWLDSSSPYGPLWLRLSELGSWVSGGHPTLAALLLRLPAFAGLLLSLWALGVLARRCGARRLDGRLAPALWLGLAGPLTLVLGLGGGHNDLLMLGLALAGVAVATRPGFGALAAGAALAGLGVMVKSPAAIAIAFTVPVWLHANALARDLRRVVLACATAVAGAAAAVVAVTAATGLGLGWTRQVNADAQWVSWLSLPSGLVMLGKAVTGGDVKAVDGPLRAARSAGEALTVVLVVAAWLLALHTARRVAVLGWLAAALGAAALLAPSVQPWYYLWALALAGLVVLPRAALIALVAVTVIFPVMITPSGFGYESSWPVLPMIAGAVLVAWLALREATRSAAHDDNADHARTEVRADDGAEFGHV